MPATIPPPPAGYVPEPPSGYVAEPRAVPPPPPGFVPEQEHPVVKNMIAAGADPAYALKRYQESLANPTPRETQEAQAQASVAGQNTPGRAFVQGVKGYIAPAIKSFDPATGALIEHEQAVEHPVAPTLINKVAGAAGNIARNVAEYATGGPIFPIVEGVATGTGTARGEAATAREQGRTVTPGQEIAAAGGYSTINAAQNVIPGGVLGKAGALISGGIQAVAGATGRAGENLIAQQTTDPNRKTSEGVLEAGVTGGIAGTAVHGVSSAVRNLSGRRGAPEAAPVERSEAKPVTDAQPVEPPAPPPGYVLEPKPPAGYIPELPLTNDLTTLTPQQQTESAVTKPALNEPLNGLAPPAEPPPTAPPPSANVTPDQSAGASAPQSVQRTPEAPPETPAAAPESGSKASGEDIAKGAPGNPPAELTGRPAIAAPTASQEQSATASAPAGNRPIARSGMAAFGKGNAPPREQFADPAVEARYREASGVKQPSVFERLTEGATALKNSFTRNRVYLDTKQPADAKLDNTLRLREAEQAAAPGAAKQMIESYVKDLDLTEYDRFGRSLVLPDIVKDIDAGRYEGKDLPFGFKDKAQIESEITRIEKGTTPKLKAALAKRQAEQKEITQKLVDLDLLPKEVLNDDRYYHRQVMEYMGQRQSVAIGGKGVKYSTRGFQKGRVGGGDFNTRYEQAEHEYLTHALRQIATKETLSRIEADHDIAPQLRKQYGKDWQDHIPDDHSLWSPKIGTSFAAVQTIPESIASKVIAGTRDLADSDLREMFARVPGKQLVIPKNFADQLDHMPARDEGALGKMNAAALASWKQWTLLSPLRAVKYNLNNMSGDVDVAVAADPKILLGVTKAWRDLSQFNKDKAPAAIKEDVRLAQKLGVIDSGQNLNEIPDISDTGVFRNLTNGNSNPVKWYWEKVRGFSTMRENLTRLAAFRRARELIAAGQEPLWASKPSELKAITDPNERAAKLSRDLMGDYGNISEAGQTIRRRYIPFYSWMEINAPRYLRMFMNAATPGEKGRVIGAAAGKAALKVGSLAARSAALYTLVHLYNKASHPDEDDGFEDGRLRLIVGKTKSGRTIGIKFQGAFSDVLSWAGMDDAPGMVNKVRRGEMSAGDVATSIGKAPINKLVGAALPLQKTIAEASTGKSMYPDVFNPRTIRDRGEHVARSVGLDSIYRSVKDIPQDNPALGLIAQSTDPGENAYREMRGQVHDWLDKNHIEKGGGEPTDRSNALYYFKSALAKGDREQAIRWRKRYMSLGGSDEGMKRSIEMANPLSAIPEPRRAAYVGQLSPEQRKKWITAMTWYRRVYKGESAVK